MPRRAWTKTEIRLLRKLYPVRGANTVAKELGRSAASVYNMAHKLKIEKALEFFASDECGWPRKGVNAPALVATQYPKGHVPANKGLRRPGYAPGRMRETQFKKGVLSGKAAKNYKPVGTIVADPEGFLRIKIDDHKGRAGWHPDVWPLLAYRVWEDHMGKPVPPKHVIRYKDGDRSNCAIENLELISMKENRRRNSPHGMYPRELQLAIAANGALKRKLRRIDGKEQNHGSQGPSVRDDRGSQRPRQPDGDRARQGDLGRRANDHQLGEGRSGYSQGAERLARR